MAVGKWIKMTEDHLDLAKVISDQIWVNYQENDEVFAEKLQLFPQGCWVAMLDNEMVGYTMAFPALLKFPPSLNEFLGGIVDNPDCLYWHDIGILPKARGYGLGKMAMDTIINTARDCGLGILAGISVNNSSEYWKSLGSVPYVMDGVEDKIKSYGADAVYMIKRVGPA